MKKILLLCLSVLALYLVVTCSRSNAAGDFKPLFNGQDLTGWVNVNCAPETWTVKDKIIVCTGKPIGVLRTDRQYENYVLELEWRHMQAGGNAGLFVHSDDLPVTGQPFTRSVEIQIMDGNAGDIFGIQGATMVPFQPHPQGWMRSLPTSDAMKPTGQWNQYRVECRNGMIDLWVNGTHVNRVFNANPRKGYICLESEGSEVHFRNIRINELPATNPPAAVTALEDRGFVALYNGIDLRGWKQDPGHEGHWKADDWKISYDGGSTAEDKNLWSEKDYGDFTMIVDWRLSPEAIKVDSVPVVLPDGSHAKDEQGNEIKALVNDAGDSGIYIRGDSKNQFNIWNWPVGSGEVYGYRMDETMPPEVRAGVTPILNADKPIGEWNRFEITAVGDRVTVLLNGQKVLDNAQLPGMAATGPIALQHHGDPIEFGNIYIKEL